MYVIDRAITIIHAAGRARMDGFHVAEKEGRH